MMACPTVLLSFLSLAAVNSLHIARCASPRLCAAGGGALEVQAAKVKDLHERFADTSGKGGTADDHIARQIAVFSEAAEFFASDEASPVEVQPNLRAIAEAVAAACDRDKPAVLDVGTGAGALLPFYEAAGISLAHVTGVDPCDAMLSHARARFPRSTFVTGGILDVRPSALPYDCVVFNAVFGNLYDQQAALAHAAKLVKPGGSVIISHPLGGAFVQQLKASDPTVVPNGLPDEPTLVRMLLGSPPLRLASYKDDTETSLYLARLTRSLGVGPLPAALCGALPALRGPVANGFGRGSKKLGIPTANLPCSLFQDALEELPCGVYVGWAAVRGGVHKCVCNIGFSPTFAGAENPEKIVEAHVMHEFDNDFYGEAMGLLLLGFIRDERKFGGLDELLSTIHSDIDTARAELDVTPLAQAAQAPWLLEQAEAGARAADGEEVEVRMAMLDPTELLMP